MSLLFDVLIFSFLGLGLEAAFTAALDYPRTRDRHLMGYSSIWYLPLYALVPIFFRGFPAVLGWPWPLRGLLYMVLIYAAEFSWMGALRRMLGKSPSEESYYKTRWHVRGLIRLDFAAAWFAAGLFLEAIYRHIHIHPFRASFPAVF